MVFEGGMPAQAVIEAFGWTLLDFIWQGALIALGYSLLRKLLASHSASFRLAAGYLALAGFTLAPVLTLLSRLDSARLSVAEALTSVGASTIDSSIAAVPNALTWSFEPLLPLIVAVWALGVACLVLRGLWRWRGIRQVCLEAQPMSPAWQRRIVALHARVGLRVSVLVRESAQVAAPILVGWIKPTVLLPLGLCTRMPVDQLELILAHEFAHVRRFDAWANAAQLAIETLLFYHPAVHWVGRRVRDDRELCCDALVTSTGGDRLTYARALLALAEQRREMDMGNLALAATGGVLLGRVEQLLGVPREQQTATARMRLEGLLPAALTAMGVLLLANPFESSLISDQANTPLSAEELRLAPISLARPTVATLTPAFEIVVRDLTPSLTGLASALTDAAETPVPAADSADPLSPSEGPLISATAGQLQSNSAALPSTDGESAYLASAGLTRAGVANAELTSDVALTPMPANTRASASRVESADTSAIDMVESLRVLTRSAPVYPSSTLSRGIEGKAELGFQVDRQGKATAILVISASHTTFANAAIEALQRWRFDPTQASSQRHMQGFDFTLPSSSGDVSCLRSTGTRLCRRNL